MRIVAGAARGRRLMAPPGQGTRPTSDRVREALFSTVESVLGSLAGRRVLDLYAGSGAVGLEAMSRGAAHVLLVERDPRTLRTLRHNVDAVGGDAVVVNTSPVDRVVAERPIAPYDLVFVDPPYDLADGSLHAVLTALAKHGWLTSDALVVVERSARSGDFSWPEGFHADRARRYGETMLWYGRPN